MMRASGVQRGKLHDCGSHCPHSWLGGVVRYRILVRQLKFCRIHQRQWVCPKWLSRPRRVHARRHVQLVAPGAAHELPCPGAADEKCAIGLYARGIAQRRRRSARQRSKINPSSNRRLGRTPSLRAWPVPPAVLENPASLPHFLDNQNFPPLGGTRSCEWIS